MWGHHFNSLGDLQTGRVGIHDKRRDSFGAGFFAGADKEDVKIGDAAIRYPRLFSVDYIRVALFSCRALQSGDIRACIWFRDRKSCDGSALHHTRKIALLLLMAAEDGNRP